MADERRRREVRIRRRNLRTPQDWQGVFDLSAWAAIALARGSIDAATARTVQALLDRASRALELIELKAEVARREAVRTAAPLPLTLPQVDGDD